MVTARATQTRAQVVATRVKCIVLGIDSNFQRRTFRVRDLITGQVTMRRAIIRSPTADAGEAVSSDTATKGGGGGGGATRALLAVTQENPSRHVLLGSLETVSE